MIKSICYQLVLIVWLLNVSAPIRAQEQTKHFNQGEPVSVRKKDFKDYSVKVPEYVDVSVKNEQFILKFVSTPDFAVMLVVKYYDKKAETELKELFRRTINLNGKHSIWDMNQIVAFTPEELKKGNAGLGYLINGHSSEKLPMKIYNVLGITESGNNKKILIFSGSISVNPAHKYYKDFSEIQRYINDFKMIMISTEFKE